MARIRALVLGASGFIGQAICDRLIKEDIEVIAGVRENKPWLPCNQVRFNIEQISQFSFKILESIDVIFNCSGLIGFSACDKNPEKASLYNAQLPYTFIENIKVYNPNLKWIQLSTNAVFGSYSKPASEIDACNPTSTYGKTKKKGEDIVINSGISYLIIRTCDVFGEYKFHHVRDRFVHFVAKVAVSGNKEFFPTDVVSNPIEIDQFISDLFLLYKHKKIGVYHLAGEKSMTRFDFAIKIAKKLKLPLKNLTKTQLDSSANLKFDLYNVLDTSLIKSIRNGVDL